MVMPEIKIHRAARVDVAIMRWRARRARERGRTPTVIPYTGYGSTSWVRILARVLLASGRSRLTGEPTGARGWRSFTGVPVENAVVRVEVGGFSQEVTADRSGIVDQVVEATLAPGWQRIQLTVEGSAPVHADVFVVADDDGLATGA